MTHALIDASEGGAHEWHTAAEEAVALTRLRGDRAVSSASTLRRKQLMDRFRLLNGRLAQRLEQRRAGDLEHVSDRSVLIILGLAALFGFGGWATFGRRAQARLRRERRDARQRDRQSAFAHTLQFMDSEEEAHALVKRHLEQSIPGSDVVVMQRNNSADRLEATTPVDPAGPLAVQLVDAQPRSCLAVRLGSGYSRAEADELLEAAPVVANMRNLAVAEMRAATDALTGLPNRRAIQDTLRRMVAQAARSGLSLSAVAVDLDHFKSINDRYGHDKGDEVLAAASQVLRSTLRTSDFVGRQGGEEFIVLLPDTGLDGALVAAENLRTALERIAIDGVNQPITASFGVAVLPEDGADADTLVRCADRALYLAKDRGRNRVETAASVAAVSSPQTAA